MVPETLYSLLESETMPGVDWDTFIEIVQSGDSVVSFPTDTVPALACRPESAELLYQVKQRSWDKPLILMAASAGDLWPYVSGCPEELSYWQEIANQFWPGALTLVLPASNRIPRQMNPRSPNTIGIRVPHSEIACSILAETGPLATTSANRSGEPALEILSEIARQFPEVYQLTAKARPELQAELERAWLDPVGSGQPSTVAQWQDQSWKILRAGSVDLNGV